MAPHSWSRGRWSPHASPHGLPTLGGPPGRSGRAPPAWRCRWWRWRWAGQRPQYRPSLNLNQLASQKQPSCVGTFFQLNWHVEAAELIFHPTTRLAQSVCPPDIISMPHNFSLRVSEGLIFGRCRVFFECAIRALVHPHNFSLRVCEGRIFRGILSVFRGCNSSPRTPLLQLIVQAQCCQ